MRTLAVFLALSLPAWAAPKFAAGVSEETPLPSVHIQPRCDEWLSIRLDHEHGRYEQARLQLSSWIERGESGLAAEGRKLLIEARCEESAPGFSCRRALAHDGALIVSLGPLFHKEMAALGLSLALPADVYRRAEANPTSARVRSPKRKSHRLVLFIPTDPTAASPSGFAQLIRSAQNPERVLSTKPRSFFPAPAFAHFCSRLKKVNYRFAGTSALPSRIENEEQRVAGTGSCIPN